VVLSDETPELEQIVLAQISFPSLSAGGEASVGHGAEVAVVFELAGSIVGARFLKSRLPRGVSRPVGASISARRAMCAS
jgi:hypothetical protein